MFSGSLKDIFGSGMGLGYRVFQLGLAEKRRPKNMRLAM